MGIFFSFYQLHPEHHYSGLQRLTARQDRQQQQHNGRHQEEDAGHEGGEGQRHGPGRRLRAGRQGRQDQERWAGLGNFLIALHGELGYWKLNTVKDLYKIWKHHQM